MKRALKRKQRREQALVSQRDCQEQEQQPEVEQPPLESQPIIQEESYIDSLKSNKNEIVRSEEKKTERLGNGKSVDLTSLNKSLLCVRAEDYHSAGNTPAIDAAVEKNIGALMDLAQKSDISIPNYRGFTVLHALAQNGQADIIRTLGVRHFGNSLNAQTHDEGSTPLIRAVVSSHTDSCHALANTLGADIFLTDNCGYSALSHALYMMTMTGDDVIVKILLESIQDEFNKYISAMNALGFAAACGMTELTEFLIDTYRLDVNTPLQRFQHADQVTPLMLAAESNHISVVKVLVLKYNANLKLVSSCGDTALMRASLHGSVDVVRFLTGLKSIQYIDLMVRNLWNHTAYSLALGMRHFDVVKILEDALKAKESLYYKAKKKAQKRKAYQRRKQSRDKHNTALIKAYHPSKC